jgi:hypothetical protein
MLRHAAQTTSAVGTDMGPRSQSRLLRRLVPTQKWSTFKFLRWRMLLLTL